MVLTVVNEFTVKSVVLSMVVPPPVELITPSVMSTFSPAIKSHDIAFVVASILIFVPADKSHDIAFVEASILIFVPADKSHDIAFVVASILIFVPADKSHDISLVNASILIFVVGVNLSCLSLIKVETLLPFNNIEFVFNALNVQVPFSSILLNSLLNMFSFVGFLFFKELV